MENARFFVLDTEGPTLIIEPVRELGGFSEDEVRGEWDQLLEHLNQTGFKSVILDLGKLSYFGSTMLEMMVVLWKRLSAKHGKLAVCNVSAVGREILHVAKFDTIWPICKNRGEALEKVTG